jgi:hypothetical protein
LLGHHSSLHSFLQHTTAKHASRGGAIVEQRS